MISKDVSAAASILISNGMVAIPTETVYGLAGNALKEDTVRSIFTAKGRPLNNPLIVHISSVDSLETVAKEIPEKARILADHFWPGPLTLLLPKKDTIPDYVTSGKTTVAVRIPNHRVAIELLSKLDFPLAAPSANPFGRISPTCAQHVEDYFGDEIGMILDGGICEHGIESTIVGFHEQQPVIYRLGSIAQENLEEVLGESISLIVNNNESPEAPGMLDKHYAPNTKTLLVEDVQETLQKITSDNVGIITLNRQLDDDRIKKHIQLSPSGDLTEAASNLYSSLHILDGLTLDYIIAERLPNNGLGKTINDKLKRASK